MSTKNNITTLNQLVEITTDADGRARQHALTATVTLGNLIPPTVTFASRGLALVIGDGVDVAAFANQVHVNSVSLGNIDQVADNLVLVCTDDTSPELPEGMAFFYAREAEISGFLGAFDVLITHTMMKQNLANIAKGKPQFDVVIDLSMNGFHPAELPPLGYYAVGRGLVSVADACDALADMTGTFDKPKFFRLDTERCAHSARGLEGCTRCIEACPADALSSVEQAITINPYLCQGMGSCATACPTEAISYALPDPDNTQHFVFQLISQYREQGGKSPVILFYAEASETELAQQLAELPSRVIPVRLEELASVGIDTWFSALAYGASQVVLATSPLLPAKTEAVLVQEVANAVTFLHALNHAEERISITPLASLTQQHLFDDVLLEHEAKLLGTKREKLAQALDLLASNIVMTSTVSAVPNGAPYGRIEIATSDCTLCMGCVAVCPTDALQSMGDRPGMTFREQDCVQCGLCEKACPESVISLVPNYNWDADERQQRQIIHEEPAAECVSCGKPFAPVSMVNMLIEKLRNHSHFQDDAIKRLSMCEDCRVRDIVSDMIDNPDNQMKV
ncbi:4Fe-4S binding protein [Enterovibrio sp. ZSDZ42]|uniref:4Fe-4S binding protein n=1 Tax=Enterovibrio gelatinilyticus TaxID=2899819 RepID=A0ABT5QZD5_9GAMM|nr:4Fe-4S binding protein [Enterovibrio sp. ZSDZ42]MDD1792896.1 4Fe-4S binding protein [Enterovibrio sp. ZSDZ42]